MCLVTPPKQLYMYVFKMHSKLLPLDTEMGLGDEKTCSHFT